MLKHLVLFVKHLAALKHQDETKFRPDLSARLIDIAEKQAPAKLKPIVASVSCDAFAARRGHIQRAAHQQLGNMCMHVGVVGRRQSDPLQLPTNI